MAIKDYYIILGIPRGETAAGIRSAYRELVKRHHPDLAGEEGVPQFHEIVEAYEVLSDPDRRKSYNHELAESEELARPSVLRPAVAPEPLTEDTPSVFGDPDAVHPSFAEVLDRYQRNFTGLDVPKSERAEGLNVEVVLTPLEAARGGVLPVGMPVFEICPACHGAGENWLFPCLDCGGRGMIERRETVQVRIPPMVRPGTVIELPLHGLGVHNFHLRVHVLIGAHEENH